jgi:hypothetical protein
MVSALVFMFRKLYLFNCSSPQVSAFEAGQVTLLCYWRKLVCELLKLFQPDTLFISTGKKSFGVRLSELAG